MNPAAGNYMEKMNAAYATQHHQQQQQQYQQHQHPQQQYQQQQYQQQQYQQSMSWYVGWLYWSIIIEPLVKAWYVLRSIEI